MIHKIGYIPQELAIHGNLKAWENVELFTSLYGIKGKQLKAAIDESLKFSGLYEKRNEFAKKFYGTEGIWRFKSRDHVQTCL